MRDGERRRAAGVGLYLAVAAAAAVLGFGTVYLGLRGSDNGRALAEAAVATRTSLAQAAPAATVSSQSALGGASAEAPAGGLSGLSKGHMAAFVVKKAPEPVPELAFVDSDGKARTLGEWKGRVVLLNLWATWCAPCLKEMPALDRLKAALGGKDFDVVALNIDRGGAEKAKKFLADNKIGKLELLHDTTGKAFAAVRTPGMPTTLLIGRDGYELGRLVGPAEWDSEEAKALMRAAVALK